MSSTKIFVNQLVFATNDGYICKTTYIERIPSELHSQLALKAQMTGRSINAIIKDLLTSQQDLLNA